jgi:hypothetical protein
MVIAVVTCLKNNIFGQFFGQFGQSRATGNEKTLSRNHVL